VKQARLKNFKVADKSDYKQQGFRSKQMLHLNGSKIECNNRIDFAIIQIS